MMSVCVCVCVQNLEMIKEREEEAGAMGKVIRKFTYKGEVEIDTADDEVNENITFLAPFLVSSSTVQP